MYNCKKISLVIPCFNEERGIEEVLKNKPSFVDEVIVVDNNSYDNTSSVARKYGAKVLFLNIRGYGLALRTGLLGASGDIIITMDGDNSHSVFDIPELLYHFEEKKYDFLSGCRFPLKNKEMPLVNKLANYFISWLIRKLFSINLKDSQSGMWILKSSILQQISATNTEMGFSQEIKLKAWLNKNIMCGEKHITFQKRIGKCKFRKFKDSFMVIWDTFMFYKSIKMNRGLDTLD